MTLYCNRNYKQLMRYKRRVAYVLVTTIWPEILAGFNLVVGPIIAIAKILVDLHLTVR